MKFKFWCKTLHRFGLAHSRSYLIINYFRLTYGLYFKRYYFSQNSPQNVKSPFPNKVVISIIDKRCHCGLSDRLRGIISSYLLCKKYSIPFKIYFAYPFNLESFLVPNKVDWHVDKDAIIFNANSLPVQLYSFGREGEDKIQEKWLTHFIKRSYSQIHIYTNAQFCLKPDIYSSIFHELFKMSDKLQDEIDKYLQDIGEKYISMTFRFQQLLGDFKEYRGDGEEWEILTVEESNRYITRCLQKIEDVHKKYGKKILVTSDSNTFLQKVATYPFVYVVFGKLIHMGSTYEKGYENHKKAFIDFFMIANAELIILARTGKMYRSGFPFSASLVNNRKFEYIEF